jgi:hypothetical protein
MRTIVVLVTVHQIPDQSAAHFEAAKKDIVTHRMSHRDLESAHLIDQVRNGHTRSRGTYGVRRVHAALFLGQRRRIDHGRHGN